MKRLMGLHRFLLLFIRYVPLIQLSGTLLKTISKTDDYNLTWYLVDHLIGSTAIGFILLICLSYAFGFCIYHRLIILCNFVNVCFIYSNDFIDYADEHMALYYSHHTMMLIILMLFIYNHLKELKYEYKDKNFKEVVGRVYKKYRCRE